MPKTVMIVDDSRVSRMMITAMISNAHADWDIIEAADGAEALINVMSLLTSSQ